MTSEQEKNNMDYIDLMRMNLDNLYESMKGDESESN